MIDYKKTDLNNQYPTMIELPQEVKLQILIDGLLRNLNDFWHSYFIKCVTLEEEPEKDIKKELHELLDKATELIYNNQEELHISFDDFITLVKIKEDLK